MKIPNITKKTVIHYVRKLRDSNIKYAWLLHGQSKTRHKLKSVKKCVSNHLNIKVEYEDYVCKIIKFEIPKYLHNMIT